METRFLESRSLQAAAATWNREERAKSSVYTTAETILAAYALFVGLWAPTIWLIGSSHENRE